MTSNIKNVCVYSSSSNFLEVKYYKAAEDLGILMGKAGFNLVYGGGNLGMMGANAQAVTAYGGQVIGVLPEKIHALGVGNPDCDKLHITKCMRTRKEKMDELSDAAVALAGGFGTLEELTEMIVQKQLGYNTKAIVILNTDGFYDNLIKFFDNIIEQNFANTGIRESYYVAKTPQEVIDYLKNYQPKHFDVYEKLKIKVQ